MGDITRATRRRRTAVVGVALVVACVIVWGALQLRDDPAASPEVCETTEYEGCPQRWDYLLVPND